MGDERPYNHRSWPFGCALRMKLKRSQKPSKGWYRMAITMGPGWARSWIGFSKYSPNVTLMAAELLKGGQPQQCFTLLYIIYHNIIGTCDLRQDPTSTHQHCCSHTKQHTRTHTHAHTHTHPNLMSKYGRTKTSEC